MWYILTVEYYSALKRREIQTHAMSWMNLENIKLNEMSQSRKDKYGMISLIRPRAGKFIETKSRVAVTGAGGVGHAKMLLHRF